MRELILWGTVTAWALTLLSLPAHATSIEDAAAPTLTHSGDAADLSEPGRGPRLAYAKVVIAQRWTFFDGLEAVQDGVLTVGAVAYQLSRQVSVYGFYGPAFVSTADTPEQVAGIGIEYNDLLRATVLAGIRVDRDIAGGALGDPSTYFIGIGFSWVGFDLPEFLVTEGDI